MYNINREYEILTENGWKSFSGIRQLSKVGLCNIETPTTNLQCTYDHKIMTPMEFVFAKDLKIGTDILTDHGFEQIINLDFELLL